MAPKKSLWVFLYLLVLGACASAGEIRYSAAPITAPPGGIWPKPKSINSSGQVVGSYSGYPRAFLWTGSTSIDLGDIGGPQAWAEDINNSGEIVGSGLRSNTGADFGGFIYSGGQMSLLGDGVQGIFEAFAINDEGISAGIILKNGCPVAVTIDDTEVTELGSLLPSAPYPDSYAYDINADGAVAGSSIMQPPDGPTTTHAVIFEDGHVTDIGKLGSAGYSEALAINDSGAAVGSCWIDAIQGVQAFVYSDGKFKILGSLNQKYRRSQAEDINNSGVVVGNCYNEHNETIPFLYENGKMIDLNTVLPLTNGATPGISRLKSVSSINDAGQIVGTCDWVGGSLESGAVILTPLPAAGVAAVSFSPSPSTFAKPVNVRMDTATRKARIHYTTDGSEPTQSSPRYRGSLKVRATTTIKARAFKPGMLPSPTAIGVFTISP